MYACNKAKTVLICGDHVCINKAEAEQYFEDNLTLEVKIIDKKAKKNMISVALKKGTLHHPITSSHGSAKVYMQPAGEGTGVIAGGAMRAVVESVGVHDILAKSKGSSNPHNVVKATMDALLQMRDARSVATQRGISMSKVFNGK